MLLITWLVLIVAAVGATAVVLKTLREVPNEFSLIDPDELARGDS